MKIYTKTVGSQFGSFSLGDIPEVDQIARLKAKQIELSVFEKKIRKLHIALSNLAVAEPPQALELIAQANAYVKKIDSVPTGLTKDIKIIAREIASLKDGLQTGQATKADMYFSSGLTTLKNIQALSDKVKTKLSATDSTFDDVSRIIQKNKTLETKIPVVKEGGFGIARVPVAFSFERTRNQSSIGYLDKERLEKAGFKADFIDGYAVIHNQLVIGIQKEALNDYPVVRETKLTYKADKPVKVNKRRPATLFDVASDVLKQIEAQTKTKWIFVKDRSYPLKGAAWFWAMSKKDATALAKVFPGGRLNLQSWGIAV